MYIGSKRGIISQFERYSLYLSFEPEVWAELAAPGKTHLLPPGRDYPPGRRYQCPDHHHAVRGCPGGNRAQIGRGIVTHIIGPGAVWGMPSTYADDVTLPTRTSLTAMSECEVCHVPRHILLQWVEKDRRNYEHIIHHECRKSLVFVQHIELLSIPTVRCGSPPCC